LAVIDIQMPPGHPMTAGGRSLRDRRADRAIADFSSLGSARQRMVRPAALLHQKFGDRTPEFGVRGGWVYILIGRFAKMNTFSSKGWLVAGVVLAPLVLSGCVVWKSDYDALKAQNQQLQSQNQQLQAQVERLQHAMAYTVNSDLLFKSGSWEMSDRGKDIIAKLAQKLAPTQQNKLMVSGYTDNAPIGPGLKKRGVTSNQELSQKRADAVMQFLISRGVQPDNVAARGFGDADPVAQNDTPQGRAQNRRVVLSVGGPAAAGSSATQ
jgi:chemotaxis protein MotB